MSRSRTHPTAGAWPLACPLAIGALALWGALWPAPALARALRHQRSANWAGYAITTRAPLRSASGWWVAPAAVCHRPFTTYSAFWVGLGGFKKGSTALEQIGSETDCTATGRTDTYAWAELVPAAPIKLKLTVRPRDLIAARVSVDDRRVTLHIQNLTTDRSFTKTVSMRQPDTSSAEWIAEAPSECVSATQCQPLPLTDFGTVRFTRTVASTASGQVGTISDSHFTTTELTLSASGPMIGPQPADFTGASGEATPDGLSHHGSSFTVTFKQGATPAPPPPIAAPDQLRHASRAPLRHAPDRATS